MHKIIIVLVTLSWLCCGKSERQKQHLIQDWDTLHVMASAYNDLPSQTTKTNASITAFGDTLKEGMNVIAVSRDLLSKGLVYNTQVKIEGLQGTYLVKDKMNKRWTNKIDIYMGRDITRAKNWGVRPVTIYYCTSCK